MPVAERELIFDAIRRTLVTPKDCNPDSSLVAQITISTLDKIATQLEPMIGLHGVEVLFSRSLYLAGKEFSWLIPTDNRLEKAMLITFINEHLKACELNEATKTSYTLLATVTELLISLIGISLTNRLLEPVWAPQPPTPQKGSKS